MEISGKVLREVEFRDRLRGYDTDEVDEFLEKVALAIDDLRAEVQAANDRLRNAESRADESPGIDDDSLRRTLVLAQRTADLAIKEARDEAARLVDDARGQAESVLGDAREEARQMRSAAEDDLHDRVGRLSEQRERLERDVLSLVSLVESERGRLTDSLNSLLRHVADSLAMSEEATAHSGEAVAEQPRPTDARRPGEGLAGRLNLPDVEAEIEEDASEAVAVSEPPPAQPRFGLAAPPAPSAEDADPDEELWTRWAQGESLDDVRGDEPTRAGGAENFRFGREDS